jgi:hypothetical protein
MPSLYRSFLALILVAVFAHAASAQTPEMRHLQRRFTAESRLTIPPLASSSVQAGTATGGRDSLWNGTLIGLGAGIGAAAALDAVFCANGFGRCDFPWAAYLTLGGIGAGAGAGIDFLIGRSRTAEASEAARPTVRMAPVVGRDRKGMVASLRF